MYVRTPEGSKQSRRRNNSKQNVAVCGLSRRPCVRPRPSDALSRNAVVNLLPSLAIGIARRASASEQLSPAPNRFLPSSPIGKAAFYRFAISRSHHRHSARKGKRDWRSEKPSQRMRIGDRGRRPLARSAVTGRQRVGAIRIRRRRYWTRSVRPVRLRRER